MKNVKLILSMHIKQITYVRKIYSKLYLNAMFATKRKNSCVHLTTHVKTHIQFKYSCDVCVKRKEDFNTCLGKLMLSTICRKLSEGDVCSEIYPCTVCDELC